MGCLHSVGFIRSTNTINAAEIVPLDACQYKLLGFVMYYGYTPWGEFCNKHKLLIQWDYISIHYTSEYKHTIISSTV